MYINRFKCNESERIILFNELIIKVESNSDKKIINLNLHDIVRTMDTSKRRQDTSKGIEGASKGQTRFQKGIDKEEKTRRQ